MSADCIGGKMLVTLAAPDQTHLSCPCCGATGLQRASVVNGHGVVPHHKVVPHRSAGIVAAQPAPHDLTDAEVALAKILAAIAEYDATAAPWRNIDAKVYAGLDYAADGLCAAGLRAASYLTPQGRALLDRARKAGVL